MCKKEQLRKQSKIFQQENRALPTGKNWLCLSSSTKEMELKRNLNPTRITEAKTGTSNLNISPLFYLKTMLIFSAHYKDNRQSPTFLDCFPPNSKFPVSKSEDN